LLHNAGYVHDRQGDLDSALHHYRRAHRIRERLLGAQDPETARTLYNMGLVLRDLQQPDSAIDCLKKCVAAREASLGPDHDATARAQLVLASMYLATNRPRDATVLAKRAYTTLSAVAGQDDPDTAYSRTILANLDYTSRPTRYRPRPTLMDKVESAETLARQQHRAASQASAVPVTPRSISAHSLVRSQSAGLRRPPSANYTPVATPNVASHRALSVASLRADVSDRRTPAPSTPFPMPSSSLTATDSLSRDMSVDAIVARYTTPRKTANAPMLSHTPSIASADQ
jgi:hypothetical protein